MNLDLNVCDLRRDEGRTEVVSDRTIPDWAFGAWNVAESAHRTRRQAGRVAEGSTLNGGLPTESVFGGGG